MPTHTQPKSIWSLAVEQVGAVLRDTASKRALISYSDLARKVVAVDLAPRSPELARVLCEISMENAAASQPWLTSLVINHASGRPGRGFFKLARHYFQFEDDEMFWLGEVSAAFDEYGTTSKERGMSARTTAVPRPRQVPVSSTAVDQLILSFFD